MYITRGRSFLSHTKNEYDIKTDETPQSSAKLYDTQAVPVLRVYYDITQLGYDLVIV